MSRELLDACVVTMDAQAVRKSKQDTIRQSGVTCLQHIQDISIILLFCGLPLCCWRWYRSTSRALGAARPAARQALTSCTACKCAHLSPN